VPDKIEIKVVCSGAFKPAYLALVPAFERATSHVVKSAWGGSYGDAPTTIPSRLRRGEAVDLVILASEPLDRLIAEGKVTTGSRVDLARCGVGVAVRAGAPKPDISSTDAFKRTLLQAKSIAHSSSASGVYLRGLFQRLGIAGALAVKTTQVEGEPVGAVIARGDAEIGFQQMSELIPVAGIDLVGPLPAEIQQLTIFAAGVPATASQPKAARALVGFLTAPAAAETIRRCGMEPA
jgi:molybdate transport system substrate-binding protein